MGRTEFCKRSGDDLMHPAIMIAPQCPANMQWSSFTAGNGMQLILNPTPSKPMELLMELIRQSIKNLPVDTNRIYITGLSMGGYGTYDAIERYPHLICSGRAGMWRRRCI